MLNIHVGRMDINLSEASSRLLQSSRRQTIQPSSHRRHLLADSLRSSDTEMFDRTDEQLHSKYTLLNVEPVSMHLNIEELDQYGKASSCEELNLDEFYENEDQIREHDRQPTHNPDRPL